jgi:type I restriction enzyme S subunit
MELRPGHKQTEVGLIPEDWGVEPLGKMASFRTGPFGTAIHKSDYTDGGVPVINPMHIVDGRLVPTGSITVTEEAAEKLAVFRLKAGDVVMGRRGDMGRCAVVQEDQTGWLCGTGSLIIRPTEETVPDFLQRVLSCPPTVIAIRNASVGSTMINLNQSVLAAIPIQSPPLPEQRAIAGALGDVDALLGALEKLIAKKRDLKQAAMQQLLTGQTRLPGFSGEWEAKPIGDFADCTAGGTPSTLTPSYWGGTIQWMNSGELNLKLVAEVEGRITEEGLRNSSAKLIPKKCVLVGLAGQGKTRGTVAINLVELCTNQSIAAILPSPAFVPEYLYYNLDTRYDELRALSSGEGGRGGLNLTIIKSIRVPLPSHPEQTAIARVLSDMDAEIAALEQRLAKTRALKQGMMQELLTGKTRLV